MKSLKINIWDLKILTLIVIVIAVVLSYSGALLFPVKPVESGIKISFFLAFLGGFLALLSPCSAVLLPAFFSYSFQDKRELFKMTYAFFLGLLAIFIPLGFSTSIISFLFSFYREITFIISGTILILLGLVKIFNIAIPFLHVKYLNNKNNMTSYVFLTGMFFSFTTIACTGPILGGIATMAASFGFSSVMAILLLSVFALGLVIPLFILSLIFTRYNISRAWIMREKTLKIREKEIRFLPVNIISGLIFVLLGLVLVFYESINPFFFFGGDDISNIYLNITTVFYEYMTSNTTLNLVLSILLIVIVSLIIFKIIKKTKHLNT